ncbi:unnamed protein product [Heligmosomoides polygyrus]|uniref:Dynein light chain 1, cytoplasmic n=1 Tax=Heligmosomoides polygyrus TaxID=6339 RepID=A0A3P7YGC8_HELPZ|nr:unnamed protein product [Heligmosomoides polygyrus]
MSNIYGKLPTLFWRAAKFPEKMSSLVSSFSLSQPSESKGLVLECSRLEHSMRFLSEDCSSGLVDHTAALVEAMEVQFSNPEFWDVTFIVDGERFHAHRFILATRSEYFRAMLCGGLKESAEAEIKLSETKPLDFRTLLSSVAPVGGVRNSSDRNNGTELLSDFGLFVHVEQIYTKLDISNVFTIADISTLLSLNALSEGCKQFCDQHAPKILAAQSVDLATLIGGLITKNCLRLHLMSQNELLTAVGGSKIFAANSGVLDKYILGAIRQRDSSGFGMRYRGSLLYDQNVATAELGAVFLVGGNPNMLLSAGGKMSSCRPSPQPGHRSGVVESNDEIVLQLGRPYTINTVVLKHQEWQTGRAHSYRVELRLSDKENTLQGEMASLAAKWKADEQELLEKLKKEQEAHKTTISEKNNLEEVMRDTEQQLARSKEEVQRLTEKLDAMAKQRQRAEAEKAEFVKVSSLFRSVLAKQLSSATTLCAERLEEVTRLQGVVKSLANKVQSLESRNSELNRKLTVEEERFKKSEKEKDDAINEDMEQDAVDCAIQAFEKHNNENDISRYIQKEFNRKYNPKWHCIVGKDYKYSVGPDAKHYIYFEMGQLEIALFKAGISSE